MGSCSAHGCAGRADLAPAPVQGHGDAASTGGARPLPDARGWRRLDLYTTLEKALAIGSFVSFVGAFWCFFGSQLLAGAVFLGALPHLHLHMIATDGAFDAEGFHHLPVGTSVPTRRPAALHFPDVRATVERLARVSPAFRKGLERR